jgi:cyclopropane fatty-acyl-phospholipid synthase-like methyltransferase
MSSRADSTTAVRQYYDQNTRFFSSLGSSSKTHSIHRALWPPGVKTLDDALNHSNQLVLQAVQPHEGNAHSASLTLADLGCGMGGTLIFLLQNLPVSTIGLGLTLSPVQAHLARFHLTRAGVQTNALIVEGDFCSLPLAGAFDALFSIEAFVHAPDPDLYLSEAARVLRPGGRLVLVDDFLPTATPPADAQQRRWLQSYRIGWRVPGLSVLAHIIAQANICGLGLLEDRDLTAQLRFRTLPPILTHLILSLGERLPLRHAILPSMLGSLALQHCLQAGCVQYHLLVFEKQPGARMDRKDL